MDEFKSFTETGYTLFRLIFGADIQEEDQMYKIDYAMTTPLILIYIGIMTLLSLNLFIALLSSTFSSIEEKAEKYLFYQRAVVISEVEHLIKRVACWPVNFLTEPNYNPFIDEKFKVADKSIDFRISQIEDQMKEQMNILVYFYVLLNIFKNVRLV